MRESCLDHVYELELELELHQKRINAENEVWNKIIKQKREECAARLEVSMQETEVECANDRVWDEPELKKK